LYAYKLIFLFFVENIVCGYSPALAADFKQREDE
jgi:hypothetical protein